MNELKYQAWLKGIENYNPFEFEHLESFCRSLVYSASKILELSNENKKEVYNHILIAFKNNENLIFEGRGSFASVFTIKGTDKSIKINVSTPDSILDPWFEYISQIHNSYSINPWLPKVEYIFVEKEVYGAIVERLTSIKVFGRLFEKEITNYLNSCISCLIEENHHKYQESEKKLKTLLIEKKINHNVNHLLPALALVIKTKRKESAQFDIVGPNIMIDANNNIVINDPLSYSSTSSIY